MSRRASVTQLSSQQENFSELKLILADNRSNIQAIQNPENTDIFKYLRPSSVGGFAAGIGLLEVPEQLNEQQERVFIPDPKEGFVEGTVIQRNHEDKTIFVKSSRGKDIYVKSSDAMDVNPSMFEYCENMARLTHLNDASLLHNLRLRYELNLIHTYSGLFCIIINPWRWLPLYSDDISLLYKGQPYSQMPPHVYAVADYCYSNMLQGQTNQSILITGESGSGKTVNIKKIIHFFTTVAHCPGRSSLEQQIVATNPVLEAFGNAKTVHNDNSSRFGKFIRVYFKTSDAKVYGAHVESYLLEKSRVINQGAGERSFHIFYMLLSSKSIKDELQLEGTAGDYRFLANGIDSVASIDDEVEMLKLERSLEMLGFNENKRLSLFKMTAAVVLLGQMKFTEISAGNQAYISGMDEPKKVAGLLGLSPHDLVDYLTEPTVKIGHEVIKQSRSLAQVMFSVNAVAKTMYEKIFFSLVKKLNKSIAVDKISVKRFDKMLFIGLLDVAGFEIFMLNSFEQLCINYTNERLQQFFNHRMFVLEQEIYLEEGIPWNPQDFRESLEPTINLIDRPMGVLSLLEEECMVPKGNDKEFLEKLDQNHSAKSPAYAKAKPSRKNVSNAHFTIHHYAATVNYNADGWIDKNKDPMNECMIQLFRNSTYKHVADLWENSESNRNHQTDISASEVVASASHKGKRHSVHNAHKSLSFMTISSVYREQLNNLLDVLDETEPHFIRCIVPNYEKKPGHIDGPLVLHQLKCNGVLEGIRICQEGFPNRVLYEECSNRFGILASDIIQWNDDPRTACKKIIKVKGLKLHNDVEFGNTKLFFRAGILGKLEKWRTDRIQELVIMIQAQIRAYLAQAANRSLLIDAQCVIRTNIRHWSHNVAWDWYRLLIHVRPLMKGGDFEQQEEMQKIKQTQITLKEELDKVTLENNMLMRRTLMLQAANSEVDAKKLALENELEALKAKSIKEKADYQNEVGRSQNELRILKGQLEDMKQAQHREDEQNNPLKTKNMEMETTIDNLRHALNCERLAREEIEQSNGRASKDVEDLRRTLADILKEKQKLEGIQEMESNRSSRFENQVADLRDKCERFMKYSKELEKRIEELQDLLHDEKQQRRKVENSRSILQDENQNLHDKITRLEKTNSNQADLLKNGASENRRLEKLLQETETKMQFEIGELRRRHKTSMDSMQEQLEAQHKKALHFETENQSLKSQLQHENHLTRIDPSLREQHPDRNIHSWEIGNLGSVTRIMRSESPMGGRGMNLNGRSNSVSEYDVSSHKKYYSSEYSSQLPHRKSLENELMKKIEDLQKELRDLDREKRMWKRKYEEVKENLDEETMAKDSIQKQLKIRNMELQRVEAVLKNEECNNCDLQHQVQKMHYEVNMWKTKFEDQVVEQDVALNHDRRRQLEKLKSAIKETETASNRVTMLNKQQSELQSQLAEIQQELNRALGTIATNENLHGTQEKTYEHLCEQYKIIVKEVDEIRIENGDLKLKINHIERRNLIENGQSSESSYVILPHGDQLAENIQLNQEIHEVRKASVQLIDNFNNELQNVKNQLKQQHQNTQSPTFSLRPEIQLQLNEKVEEVTKDLENSKRVQKLLETELQLSKEIVEGKDKIIQELKMATQEYKTSHSEIHNQAHGHAKNAAELADRLHELQKENAKLEDLMQEQQNIVNSDQTKMSNEKSDRDRVNESGVRERSYIT